MPKDSKTTGIIIGVGAGLAGLVYLATRAKVAPPEPEPGLANLYGRVTDSVTRRATSLGVGHHSVEVGHRWRYWGEVHIQFIIAFY